MEAVLKVKPPEKESRPKARRNKPKGKGNQE
jgi:hypothetical protein